MCETRLTRREKVSVALCPLLSGKSEHETRTASFTADTRPVRGIMQAQEYLAQHGVESAIAAAVSEVVLKRPEDPCKELGRLLIASASAKTAAAPKKPEQTSAKASSTAANDAAAAKIAGYLKCMSAKLKRSGKGEQNAEMLLFHKAGDELVIEDHGGWAIRNPSMIRMLKELDASVSFLATCPRFSSRRVIGASHRKTPGGGVELHLWQSQPVTPELRAKLPLTRVLSMCGTPKYADIPVPDWCFDAWPEAGVPLGECM